MKTEDIIEIVLLIVFFVVSPLLQRRRRQQAGRGQVPAPEPGEAPTSWPARGPQVVSDYSVYLVQQLRELSTAAQRIRAAVVQSPLLELPHLAPVAEQLVERATSEADQVLRLVREAVGDGEPSPDRALALSRAIETGRRPLARAKAAQDLLRELTSQRTDPRALSLLRLLDRLLDELTAGSSTDTPRQRLALFYDGDPLLVGELVGAGPAALIPISRQGMERAGGWVALGQALGFDALAAAPGALEELRAAAMVGPLADRSASPPFFAGAVIDMAAAAGAWTPTLAADVVATCLLGRAYALGVVMTAVRQRIDRIATVTISTGGGRYHPEPPLLVRLTLIDAVLDLEGRTEPEDGMAALGKYLELPSEGRYVLPNGLTQRLLLQPLLDYARQLAQTLHATRVNAAGDRRLSEVLAPRRGVLERTRVLATARGFLDGQLPAQPGPTLLAGAILAEYDDAEGRTFVQPLVRALTAPRRARRQAVATRGAATDRALLRDALVLSEIL